MSTTSVEEVRRQSDENALRVVRALMSWHDLAMPDIAAAIGQSIGTIERRLSRNQKTRKSFYTWELDLLSRYFGVPVESFHHGQVDLSASRLADPRDPTISPMLTPDHDLIAA